MVAQQAVQNHAALIWGVAELLRGDFKQSEYQKVVLPFTVLRRLDAVLEAGKADFLRAAGTVAGHDDPHLALRVFSQRVSGRSSTTPVR